MGIMLENDIESARSEVGCGGARALVVSLAVAMGCLHSLPVLAQTAVAKPPERVQADLNGVDVVGGTVVTSITPLSIGSAEYGLSLTHLFAGRAWSESLSGILEVTKHGLLNTEVSIVASWNNQTYSYPSNGLRSEMQTSLSMPASDEYELTLGDSTRVTYRQLGTPFSCGTAEPCSNFFYPTRIERPNGLITLVHYAVSGTTTWQVRIQSVTNNAGYQIKFNYASNSDSSASWRTLASAVAMNNAAEYCSPDADTCSFSQAWPTAYFSRTSSSSGAVYTVTDPAGRVARYTNVAATSPGGASYFKIKTPANGDDDFVYTFQTYVEGSSVRSRVASVTRASKTWTYTYPDPSSTTPMIVKGMDGKETTYGSTGLAPWSAPLLLSSITNPYGETLTFAYNCSKSEPGYFWLTSTNAYDATMPEGNAFKAECDDRGNVTKRIRVPKTGSGLTNVTELWDYPTSCTPANAKVCNKPTYYRDGKTAQTDYEYEPLHGGLKKEKLPAVNGVRPEKRYGYTLMSAYVKNAAGSLVPAAPIYVPTSVSECRTSAYVETTGSCATAGDETVTTYEYGAAGTVNRLLIRGKVVTAGGVSQRTCYSYDRLGNRISETTPRAGLSSCL